MFFYLVYYQMHELQFSFFLGSLWNFNFLPVVALRSTKPMQRKILCAHDFTRVMLSFSSKGYLLARAVAVAIATVEFTTPPLYRVAFKNFCVRVSIFSPSKGGRPRALLRSVFLGDCFLRLSSFNCDS